MNRDITPDIVTDLLPAFFSGEASPATRRLVEDYFTADSAFAARARAEWAGAEEKFPPPAAPSASDAAGDALARTKSIIRTRSQFFTVALIFTLLPFSFAFDSARGLTFLMIRDAPVIAWTWLAVAVVMWICHAVYARKLRVTGL